MNATLLPSEDILVRETLSFSRQLLGVSGALFYWIDNSRQEMQVLDTLGVPTGFLEQYTHGMQSLDPMGVRRMLERHESVGVLSMAPAVQSLNDMRHYHGYLHSFGIIDTIDLMFWGGGVGLRRYRAAAYLDRPSTVHGTARIGHLPALSRSQLRPTSPCPADSA